MAYKVAIDAGHASNTAGKRTFSFTKTVKMSNGTVIKKGTQYREHYANVMVSNFLAKELKRCGFIIYKTGWNDADASDDPEVSLSTRQKRIKAAGCDIVVSNHFNSYGSKWNNAQGIETFYHSSKPGDSKRLATKIYNQLIKGTPQTKRGIKRAAFAMVNCSAMGVKAAILNEYAFMSNEHEAQDLMASVEYCKECAVEVAKGICEYFGVTYVPEGQKKIEDIPMRTSKATVIKGLQNALNKDYGRNLTVDGCYGPMTKSALRSHNIKKGSKANCVKWLQTRLNEQGFKDGNNKALDEDGDFGAKTVAALKKMQKAYNLTQDGEFGTGTMDQLLKHYK